MMTSKNRADYDQEVDILTLSRGRITEHSVDVDNVVVDIDYAGLVSAVEILDASRKLGLTEGDILSFKGAKMHIEYKQKKAHIEVLLTFSRVKKELRLPLIVDLEKRITKKETAEFNIVKIRKADSYSMVEEKVSKRSSKRRLRGEELTQAILEARKDPEFMKEIRRFVKITTGVYKLKR